MSTNVFFLPPQNNVARRHPNQPTRPVLINGNGSYSGAPGIIQDAQFPMVSALYPGRSGLVWASGDSPGSNFPDSTSVVLEIDTVVQVTPSAWGVLGYRCRSVFPSNVQLDYLTGGTYNPTTGWLTASAAITLGTNNGPGNLPDKGVSIIPVTARYWRFKFGFGASSGNGGFSISGLFLQTNVVNLGFLYSGADETRVIPRSVVETYSDQPIITRKGGEYRRWQLRYDNNDAALRTTLDDLFSYQGAQEPFIFLTPDGLYFECVWDSDSFTRSHIWAPPDRYRMSANLRSLP